MLALAPIAASPVQATSTILLDEDRSATAVGFAAVLARAAFPPSLGLLAVIASFHLVYHPLTVSSPAKRRQSDAGRAVKRSVPRKGWHFPRGGLQHKRSAAPNDRQPDSEHKLKNGSRGRT
jgi:hypothetical protein